MIVAGYESGLVVIWKLDMLDSLLLGRVVNGIETIIPIEMFYASSTSITRK